MAEVKLDILIKAIDQASGIFGKIGAAGDKGRAKMEAFGRQAVIAGAAVTAAFTGAAVAAAKFNEGMAEVSTLVDRAVVDMGRLKDGVNDVAVATGKGASDLTSGLYDVISAGITDAADAMDVLTIAAKGAVGGAAETSVVVDGLTTTLNAFNLEASDAEHVMDLFLTTVEKGKTTLPELSKTIGRVASTAGAMGVSLEETLGIIAQMTTVTGSTKLSVTGFQQALSNILKPSAEAQELAKKLKIEFNAEAAAAKGLSVFLAELGEATDNNATLMSQFFGSVEAVNAVLAVTGENAQDTADLIAGMGDVAGTTEDKFAVMSATTAAAFNRMREKFMSLVRTVGDIVIPAFETLMGWLQPVIDLFQKIADSPVGGFLVGLGGTLGLLALAFGGAMIMAVKLHGAMKTAREGGKLLNAMFVRTKVTSDAAAVAQLNAANAAAASGTKATAAAAKWKLLAAAMRAVLLIAGVLKIVDIGESMLRLEAAKKRVDEAENLEEKIEALRDLATELQMAPVSAIEKFALKKFGGGDIEADTRKLLKGLENIEERAAAAGVELKDLPATASGAFVALKVKAGQRQQAAEAAAGPGAVAGGGGSGGTAAVSDEDAAELQKMIQGRRQFAQEFARRFPGRGLGLADMPSELLTEEEQDQLSLQQHWESLASQEEQTAKAAQSAMEKRVRQQDKLFKTQQEAVAKQQDRQSFMRRFEQERGFAPSLADAPSEVLTEQERALVRRQKHFDSMADKENKLWNKQVDHAEKLEDRQRFVTRFQRDFGVTPTIYEAPSEVLTKQEQEIVKRQKHFERLNEQQQKGFAAATGGGATGGGRTGGAVSARAGGTVSGTVTLEVVANRGGSFEFWLRNFIGGLVQESQAAHSYQGG